MCVCVCVVPDYYSPAMLGLKTDQEVLGELVKVKIPTVWQTMVNHNVMWTLVVSRWFICLYIDILPVEVSVQYVCVCFMVQPGGRSGHCYSYLFVLPCIRSQNSFIKNLRKA